MKIKLKTEKEFDAAHHLEGYEGKCSNVHGHQWKVMVVVEGDSSQLDDIGILWDFGNLKTIINNLDHKDLNEELNYNPTAENIAMGILKSLKVERPKLHFKVRVYESPKSSAEVEG